MSIKILKKVYKKVFSFAPIQKITNDVLGYMIVSTNSGYLVYYNNPERLKVLELVKKKPINYLWQ